MFNNYLKVAFRNLLKNKGHSFINISGLSVGMAACLLIALWVQDELSYDRYHEKANRIYRVVQQYEDSGHVNRSVMTPAPLGPALVREFSGIQKAARFGRNEFLVRLRDKLFYEYVFFADAEMFEMFTFPLLKGNPKTAIQNPNSMLISEAIRDKYFGKEEPVGKIITLNERRDYKITGIFKNIPSNSHFRFDFLGSFLNYNPTHLDQWEISNYHTYILIAKNYPVDKVMEKLPQFIKKYKGKEALEEYKATYTFQPLTWIHLHSRLKGEIEPGSDIGSVYISSVIALFILLIACLNYINLSTAKYANRAKEVGLRKVLGATRYQLTKQFLGESFLFSFIALSLALLLVPLFLPLFNFLTGKKLVINYVDNLFLLLNLVILFFFVGLVSGFFPAFFISGFQPAKSLKAMFTTRSIIALLRRCLVVFQFAISIIFIISTLIISNQLSYMRNKKLGFNKEYIVNIPIRSLEALKKYETTKSEFLKNVNVLAVSASSFFPGRNNWSVNYWREGLSAEAHPMISCIMVDHDFLETFGIKLVEGRNFSEEFPRDSEQAYILNESALKEIGWESPIGKKFHLGRKQAGRKGTVIGVVGDFHLQSLHQEIKPLALFVAPQWFSYLSVRIKPGNIPNTLHFLRDKWNELIHGQSFAYSFLDEDFNNLYKDEMRIGRILMIVTFLALLIACLGLFGLAAFSAEQRTKEIGIRKVFGASGPGIVLLLSKDFSRLILVANIFAWPIVWFAMTKWLQNFAYRTGIGIWIFLLTGLLTFAIALLTVSYKAAKTAATKPAEILRYE